MKKKKAMNAKRNKHEDIIDYKAKSATAMEQALSKLIMQLQTLLIAHPLLNMDNRLKLMGSLSSLLAVLSAMEGNMLGRLDITEQTQGEQKLGGSEEFINYVAVVDRWIESICNGLDEGLKLVLQCPEQYEQLLHARTAELLLQASRFRAAVAQRQRSVQQRAYIENTDTIHAIDRLYSTFRQRNFQYIEVRQKGEKALFRLLQLCYRKPEPDEPAIAAPPWLSVPVKLREARQSSIYIKLE